MRLTSDVLLISGANRRQRKKLLRLIADARANVPMYRHLYADLELDDPDLALPEILSRLPVISKDDLMSATLDERRNRRCARAALLEESTTGSSGQPFTLYVDNRYTRVRNLRFLRGLLSAGFRPWHRVMLLTDRHTGSTRVGHNRYYVSVEQSTTAILDAYRRIRPHVLYGFLTPLRLLAECLTDTGEDPRRPRLVISTAEMLDPHTRQLLRDAFGCPVSDFYGLTEMGLVAWQRPDIEGYIMSPNSVLTELIPNTGSKDRYKIIMTNLDLHASPIIRFDSGDLARVRNIDSKPVIVAFEGRCIDTIIRRAGEEISPYRITDAFRDLPGLRRFKITQHEITRFLVELEVDDQQQERIARDTRAILEKLLGADLQLDIQFRSKLVSEGSRKFRPVESLVARR